METLLSFPADTISRVVWWYGPIIQNPHNHSSPLVNVITRKIINDNQTLSDEVEIFPVALTDLTTARVGTIWIGQQLSNIVWTTYDNYQMNQDFDFDFSKHEPTSVTFDTKLPNSNYWHIPKSKYNLGLFSNHLSEYASFRKSRLTKIISDKNITVLIPSLEFLSVVIASGHEQIRIGLVYQDIDDLVAKYLQNAEEHENGDYYVELLEGKYHVNLVLLAYLKLNQITRSRLSQLWVSMQDDSSKGKMNPIVLPYHPTYLNLGGDGIWINSTTFLMIRITNFSLPTEHIIKYEKLKYDVDPTPEDLEGRKRKDLSPHELRNIDDLPTTHMQNPHIDGGIVRRHLQVKISGPRPKIIEIPKTKTTTTPPPKKEKKDQNITQISSGSATSQLDSKDIANTQQAPLSQEENPSKKPKNIAEALKLLSQNPSSKVKSFSYINNQGEESDTLAYCDIKTSQLKNIVTGGWHIIKRAKDPQSGKTIFFLRRFLIIKIHLEDQRSAFLLEIEKKKVNYVRLLFNTTTKTLTPESLSKLLRTIVKNRGIYSRRQPKSKDSNALQVIKPLIKISLPVDRWITHKHSHLSIDQQLTNFIEKALKKNIFT